MKRKFWNWKKVQIKNEQDEVKEENVLFLNGTIADESWFDDDVTPQLFKDELEENIGDITVWINSYGGDCVAAARIYNMLKEHKGKVTVKIDGIAASAASVIAMAGSKVMMSPVSMMMIHNPSTFVFGDKNQMKQVINMLDEVKESIINAYEIRTKIPRNKIATLMDNETWMNANKAIELGFADEITKRWDIQNLAQLNISESFSQVKIMNSLIEKMAQKCKIEKKNVNTVKAKELFNRLDLIKNWR